MKNIGSYIQESQMFEAEKENLKLSKEDQKQLQEILQRAITAFYNDDEDRDIEEFIKDTFADYGWSDKLMSGFIDICKQIVDKSDKYVEKLSKTDKDVNESLGDLIAEKDGEGLKKAIDAVDSGLGKLVDAGVFGDNAKNKRAVNKALGNTAADKAKKGVDNVVSTKTAVEDAHKAEVKRNAEMANNIGRDGKFHQDLVTGKYYKSEEELNRAVGRRKMEEFDKEYEEAVKKETDIKKNNQDTYQIQTSPGKWKDVSKEEYEKAKKENPRTAKKTERSSIDPHEYKIPTSRDTKYGYEKDGEITHTHLQRHYEMETPWCRFLTSGGPQKVALGAAIVGAVALTTAVAVHTARKQNEKFLAGLKARSEQADDPRIRKEYEKYYQDALKAMYKDNGKVRMDPDFSKIPEESRKSFVKIYGSGKDLRKMGKEYIKKNGSEFLEYDRDHTASSTKKEPKEQVAKAKDGSEIHARRKKSGHGMTYVRTKNGKEVGYATKDDFRRARQNEGMISLRDALLESFEI